MKPAALLLLSSCVFSACVTAPVASAGPARVTADREFQLRPGHSVQWSAGGALLGFEAVLADARCPQGEQCIRAGEARIRLWVQAAGGPREALEVQVPGPAVPLPGAAAGGQAWGVVALRLDPYPVSGRDVPPSRYVLTLKLQRGPAPQAAS